MFADLQSDQSLGNMEAQLPPKIFYWLEVWRLARPLQDLEMFLLSSQGNFLVALAVCSGHCHAGRPRDDPSSVFSHVNGPGLELLKLGEPMRSAGFYSMTA
ncbi:hypothetical protein XENOCAPTIV_011944 [Xenoophorus captivus]|uniref:Uncharacterized protein n=1 Tax=Xenoophorus captivus TaxID=1517983 RepID=A0ABV0RYH9_9TELE